MSEGLLDKLLDKDYTLERKFLLSIAANFTANKLSFHYFIAFATGIVVAFIDWFLDIGGFLSRKFWGEKKIKITFTQGDVIVPHISTTDTSAQSPAKKFFNLEYPVKTTLSELENQISKDLQETLELTDVLGTEGAPVNPENIKASTHRIVALAFKERSSWFYGSDKGRVQEDSYQLELSQNDPLTGKVKYKLN